MTRYVSAVALALLALVSFGLYNGVARVKAQQQEVEAIKAEIAREGEAIRVLKAEWTYLNQPERLQALAERHLSLAPTEASQITVPASLPHRSGAIGRLAPVIDAASLPQRAVQRVPLPRAKPERAAKGQQ